MAERFGAEGFSVALVARNAGRLAAGVKVLEGKGVRAAAFPADLADTVAAAKHKLVGLLSAKLEAEGIYVGEVMVPGTVKGTAWDSGSATLEASAIASKFWELYRARGEVRARVG